MLTPEKIQSLRSQYSIGKQTTATPTSPAARRIYEFTATADTAKKEADRANSPLRIAAETAKGVGKTLISDIQGTGESLGQAAAASDVAKNVTEGETGFTDMALRVLKQIKANRDAGKDTTRLEEAYNNIAGHTQETDLKDILPTLNKSNFEAVLEAVGVGAMALSGGTLAPAGNAAKAATNAATTVGTSVAKSTTEKLGKIGIPGLSKPATHEKAVATFTSELQKTTDKYVAARRLVEANRQKGVDPFAPIAQKDIVEAITQLKNGQIDTREAVDILEAHNSSFATLRNDITFFADEPVPFKDYRQFMMDTIEARNLTKTAEATMKEKAAAVLDKWATTYGDNIPLVEIEKLKSEQGALSKSFKMTDKFSYDLHGIFERGSKDFVDSYMAQNPLHQELNKAMQQNFSAIELLKSLDGKTPHGGRFTKILGQTAGTTAGAIAGASTGGLGGALAGSLAGRLSATAIDDILGSNLISNPMKRRLIMQMTKKDPAVMEKAAQWIKQNIPDIGDL